MEPSVESFDTRGQRLFAEWHALIERRDPRFGLAAPVSEAAGALEWLASETRVSLWNMQRHSSIDTMQDRDGLDAKARALGLELRFILPRRVVEHRSPLASSHFGYLRLAPVGHPLMVSDGRRILVGDATAEAIWTSSGPEIARALGVSQRTVSGDVREMSDRLGARSRAQAIAVISGGNG